MGSPLTTRWPAAGVCAMTVPREETVWAAGSVAVGVGTAAPAAGGVEAAGVVGRLRSSALAMWRPMAAARAAAPARVRPASDGMTKASGDWACSGSAMRRLTRGRSTPVALGLGVWEMMTPGSPGAAMCATVPSSSETRRMLMDAVRSVWPIRLGMATSCGPRLSVMRTGHSRRTIEPGAGDWARTRPDGAVGE